jgi:hypothetical protein
MHAALDFADQDGIVEQSKHDVQNRPFTTWFGSELVPAWPKCFWWFMTVTGFADSLA